MLPGIMGCIQANEALKLIVGYGEPLVGRLLRFDAQTTRFSEFKVPRDPSCPVCGEARFTPAESREPAPSAAV